MEISKTKNRVETYRKLHFKNKPKPLVNFESSVMVVGFDYLPKENLLNALLACVKVRPYDWNLQVWFICLAVLKFFLLSQRGLNLELKCPCLLLPLG